MSKEENYKRVTILAAAIVTTLNQPTSVKLKYDETIPTILGNVLRGIEIPIGVKKRYLREMADKLE